MKRPKITIKFAQTLDGKIAAKDGSSRWISGPIARRFAHRLRTKHDAVLVGIGTVLSDNPLLTTRLIKGKNPVRIVIDKNLRIPLCSDILKNQKKVHTVIFAASGVAKRKAESLRLKGAEVIFLPLSGRGHIDLARIIRILYSKNIRSLLVEGGSRTIGGFIKAGLVDKLVAIIAPKILGDGIGPVSGMRINNINSALKMVPERIKRAGDDIIYYARLKPTRYGKNV